MSSFKKLGLSAGLLKALENQNYKQPYPIQEKAIPSILKNKDLLGIAKTGSGKTASYALPVLQNLERNTTTKNRHVDALVLVPTRELAVQVQDVFYKLSEFLSTRLNSLAVYGGVSINPQMKSLQHTNILIATPGRLIELIESNALHLAAVQTLILDEADKMLNLGFKAEVDKIISFLPKKRQNLLFSATLSQDVDAINRLWLDNPVVVKIEQEQKQDDIENIKQLGYFVAEEDKGPLLRYLLREKEIKKALIFASSIYKADNIADKLRKNGFQAQAIHGKKSQKARTNSLKDFKENRLEILVATDLLARGIDIELLPYVINYELPRSPKDYIHRIGRTGRADAMGEAISFVTPETEHHFRVIQKKMKKWVDMIDSKNLDF